MIGNQSLKVYTVSIAISLVFDCFQCLRFILLISIVLECVLVQVSGQNGQRRRLVVRKRKRPVGVGPEVQSPQNALQNLQHLAATDGKNMQNSSFMCTVYNIIHLED